MKTLAQTLFVLALSGQLWAAPVVKKPVIGVSDQTDGAVNASFEMSDTTGAKLSYVVQLYKGSSSAGATEISGAYARNSNRPAENASIRVSHAPMLAAKIAGTLAIGDSVIAKVTVSNSSGQQAVAWSPSIVYRFALRDAKASFKPLKASAQHDCELYQITSAKVYLIVADVSGRAELRNVLGSPATPPNATTKRLNTFWSARSPDAYALLNTSFFSVPSYLDKLAVFQFGSERSATLDQGVKQNGIWWQAQNPDTVMYSMSYDTWFAPVKRNEGTTAVDARSKMETLTSSNIVAGKSTAIATGNASELVGRTLVGCAASKKLFYALCADSSDSAALMSLATAKNWLIAAGAGAVDSTIWLDGSGSTRLIVDGQTYVAGDSRSVPVMLEIGKK